MAKRNKKLNRNILHNYQTMKTTFSFAKSLVYIRNAKLLLEVSLKDRINPVVKIMIRAWIKKLDWILNDFSCHISYESNKELRESMFNEDSSLQVQEIMDQVFDTTPAQRDIIEAFIIDLKANKIQVA